MRQILNAQALDEAMLAVARQTSLLNRFYFSHALVCNAEETTVFVSGLCLDSVLI